MIIGLTGKSGSGKTEVCNYLKLKGFKCYSLSDILREELKSRGQKISKENLINLGNQLREKFGSGILAKRVIEKMNDEDLVIDSIRNPSEIKEFRKKKDFILLGITAPLEVRYKRFQSKKKEDELSFEEFKRLEKTENSDLPSNQQLNKCLEMADVIIENEGTIEELHEKLDNFLNKFIS